MRRTTFTTMTPPAEPSTNFRKGFGLQSEVRDELAADYDGRVVDLLRSQDYRLTVGDVTIRLAREFGFCYGVERAVDYAYQTRRKFPDKRIFLVGEIIHNPHVNDRLREMGVEILMRDAGGSFDFGRVGAGDVVILPAFGVTIDDFAALRDIGCVLVDTTCGSVLNVWKRVESYARDGFTALIHGKYYHEETRATASQVRKHPDGHYLIVRHLDEARLVCGVSVSPTRRRCWRASRWRSARKSARRLVAHEATRRARATSAASTRSAVRRRSGRTRCASCSTRVWT